MDTPVRSADRALYEADEHAWIERQIALLRGGRLHALDRESLADYLTDMNIRDHRELASRFVVLLQHLLKVRLQPERLSRSWILTILERQREISLVLRTIPSMGRYKADLAASAYQDAVRSAAVETGLPLHEFPPQSPWTAEAALAFVPPDPPPRRPIRRRRH